MKNISASAQPITFYFPVNKSHCSDKLGENSIIYVSIITNRYVSGQTTCITNEIDSQNRTLNPKPGQNGFIDSRKSISDYELAADGFIFQ